MVLFTRNTELDDTMPQTVPSAGFTPPCDYSNFADNFDLSLLPGGDQPVSPSTQFYPQSYETEKIIQPKIITSFYPSPPSEETELEQLAPDFQTLLVPDESNKYSRNIYLDVPSPYSPISQGLLSPNEQFSNYRDNLYPSSPEHSNYTPSPGSVYSTSPCNEDYLQKQYIKKENSSITTFSPFTVKEESFLIPTSPASYSSNSSDQQLCLQIDNSDVLSLFNSVNIQKQIKKEAGEDFNTFSAPQTLRELLEKDSKNSDTQTVPENPKDHRLLREALRDTSFQKKFNIRPIDFGFLGSDIKMEEPEHDDLMRTCNEEMVKGNIEPVLNMAIEQMRKDVNNTCATLGISADPSQWDSASVLSWIRWTSRQFNLPEPVSEQWDMIGTNLITLAEDDFTRRSPQGGMILHAQLEIWKAAYSEEDLGIQWRPETTSSNASSGDITDEEEEETPCPTDTTKPTTSTRSGSHIHLWQFLKELLSSPQTHGSCIRWIDRTRGIFKIEDSVKVARLWGKRKNRPAMNYDKLSRSIRQYYKKGIMKKTERSQRLVYQFCHPYCL
ncbi:unnamed protein product [Psylliodes chrysocephalus]|uniref:DNA-binding protein D-ETS-4 n=1 Tax=Psylliodes chrysocephalus TaxID=3402493 RepID=A0A9P0G7T3_9CUCU|nr:unnamed protein product [Psylliodes chrysocephala]